MDRLVAIFRVAMGLRFAGGPVLAAGLVSGGLAGCASQADERPRFERPPNVAPVATSDLGRIDAAVRRYAREHGGRLPTTLDDLVNETGPDGTAYLRRVDRDPWGGAYDYAIESSRAGTYDLRSYGPDRLPATADDVVGGGAVPRPD